MTKAQLEYLRAIAVLDMRRKQRNLDKAERKDGQPEGEFEAFKTRQAARIAEVVEVIDELAALIRAENATL